MQARAVQLYAIRQVQNNPWLCALGGGGCIQSHRGSCRSLVFHARSPWVCNCDHAWSQHKQVFRKKTVFTMNGVPIPTSVAAEMNLVARGSNPTHGSGPRPDDGGYAVTEVT